MRGYLAGSGWNEYQKTQAICGVKMPAGLKESDKLPEPSFTPSTKTTLIDEALTPESSRFWPREDYKPGKPQHSDDKQFIRDYLEGFRWNKEPPPPAPPPKSSKKSQKNT